MKETAKKKKKTLRKTLATPNRLEKNQEDEEIKRKRNLKKLNQ